MVEIGKCYVTKFGSIHIKEDVALKEEQKEEEYDFATYFANLVCTGKEGSRAYDHALTLGGNIFNYVVEIREAIDNYEFIDMSKRKASEEKLECSTGK